MTAKIGVFLFNNYLFTHATHQQQNITKCECLSQGHIQMNDLHRKPLVNKRETKIYIKFYWRSTCSAICKRSGDGLKYKFRSYAYLCTLLILLIFFHYPFTGRYQVIQFGTNDRPHLKSFFPIIPLVKQSTKSCIMERKGNICWTMMPSSTK